MENLKIKLLTEEYQNNLNDQDSVQDDTQQKREYIRNYLHSQLASIVDLREYMNKHLDGNKQMSIGRVLIYTLYYVTCILFIFKYPIQLICRFFSPQNKFANYISKYLLVVLPFICLSYFYISIYNEQQISKQALLNCIQISIGLFLIEVIFLRQKIQIIRLLLLSYFLYISLNLISTSGLPTIGLFCNIILRIRYGTTFQKFNYIRQILFAIIIITLSLCRLLSFDINSALIDSIQVLLIYKNNDIQKNNKICFIILISAQYLYNFTYPEVDDVGSYLIYGCSMLILVIVVELYKIIGMNLSYNKFFVINMIFCYFLNALNKIRQPSSIFDQLLKFLIFFIPQILIAILTENKKSISFKTSIFTFEKQQTDQLQSQSVKNIEDQDTYSNDNTTFNDENELFDTYSYKKFKSQQKKLKQNYYEDNISQNTDKENLQTRSILTEEIQMENIQTDNDNNNKSIQIQNDNVKVEFSEEIQREYFNQENIQIFINQKINSFSQNTRQYSLNIKKLIYYLINGSLLLIFTFTSFYWMMQSQQNPKSVNMSQYKTGLVYYSISQCILIAIFYLFISQKMIKSDSKCVQIPKNDVKTNQNKNNKPITFIEQFNNDPKIVIEMKDLSYQKS